ncbi:MAG TPA: biotin--[acetyl-CoA-carboxylase] ligase [Pyrinomonadaceae bacterium]|nr:biotin--[acetyl-CoA-carboxylase] ligase [Pyrinomonadaceae bacterium]
MNINLLTFDTLDSTNTEALNQARLGAEEGLCVVARQQTAGRGRHGRTWVSEADAGLYFSIVLRPKIETQFLPLITLMTGVAVHDTLGELGIDADIKWVNDLHVDGKKICGILAETTDTPRGLAVVVGIGINLKSSNFPPEIADTATSITEQVSVPPAVAGGLTRPPSPSELAESLTKFLTYFYDLLHSDNGPATIIDEWRKRSTYFSGKPVRVVLENESLEGITDGLEPNGALRVKRNDGSVTIVQAGDVEQLRAT